MLRAGATILPLTRSPRYRQHAGRRGGRAPQPALIAFATVTTARVGALASFRLAHDDTAGGYVEQDARTVRTRAAESFRTYFMPFASASVRNALARSAYTIA